ncbi:MAG: hypothetical protein L7S67_08925, partial [Flavobacteriales bacterium]|nr:hypothetical protein [Flavobacteriales bacterium]
MMKHLILSLFAVLAACCATGNLNAQNCSDSEACNYNPAFDGGVLNAPCLFIETVMVHTEGDLEGMTTYRVFFQGEAPTDFVTSVFGNEATPLTLTTTTSFYQNALGSASSAAQNPLLFDGFPNLIYDSYVTIGLSESADATAGESNPSLIPSPSQDWVAAFDPGSGADGGDIVINDIVGGIWYIFNGDANGFADENNRVLLAQLTTDGELGGTLNVQYFPEGGDAQNVTLDIANACEALPEDCTYAEPFEDCDGNCLNDADADQICDEVDDCIGALDACGVCNGPGAILDCGCTDTPEGDCDCNGNQLDAIGTCGGDCEADLNGNGVCDTEETDGCTDGTACNYNPNATNDDGSCAFLDACGVCDGPGAIYACGCDEQPTEDCDCDGNQLDALGVCGGACEADADSDGICDNEDDCVGTLDECGVCNGPGAIEACGCDGFPAGACDCEGNVLDAVGVCGGDCEADADSDGVCDDVDDCIGDLDACGICNGPGAVYACGCDEQPAEDCDCDGNQLDALGVCGGDCPADADQNGICDNLEGSGCGDPEACNFDEYADPPVDEPITDYCTITEVVASHTTGDLAGMTTYRVYIQTLHPTDFVTSVSGNSVTPLDVSTTTTFYQDILGGTTPENVNPLLLTNFPNLAYDSWVSIGLDGPADATAGESSVTVVNSPNQNWALQFEPGFGAPGGNINIDDAVGGVWYILNGDANGLPDADGRVLLG